MTKQERAWKAMEVEAKRELAVLGLDWEAEFTKVLSGLGALTEHDHRCIASAHRTVSPAFMVRRLAS